MEISTTTKVNLDQLTEELAGLFASRSAEADESGTFVFQNYAELKAHHYFSAMVPTDLGGGGRSYAEVCNIIRKLARACGSTALAYAMHQHLVAAAIWRYRNKGESAPLLKKVADGQLVLVSTGARDWLDSNGELVKTEGGYLFNAKKHFASGSVIGDIAVTSAPYNDPEKGWHVLHFGVSLKSEGVAVLDDWHVMGMRGTGSNTIVFKDVFVPESAITITRPRTGYHPVWDVVLTVAMPLIMSAYVGLAEEAMAIAMRIGQKYERNQPHFPYIIGKMNNALVSARTQWHRMVELCNNIDFKPSEVTTIEIVTLKTNVANDCIRTVQEAMTAIGGQSFYEKNTLERIFRDVNAANFHPLPEWEQYQFTGSRLLKTVL